MKRLLTWIEQQKSKYGSGVLLLAALVLFTILATILGLVYAIFMGIMYVEPYAILVVSFFLLLLILYKNRPSK